MTLINIHERNKEGNRAEEGEAKQNIIRVLMRVDLPVARGGICYFYRRASDTTPK